MFTELLNPPEIAKLNNFFWKFLQNLATEQSVMNSLQLWRSRETHTLIEMTERIIHDRVGNSALCHVASGHRFRPPTPEFP
jgi:hypothetical protein